MLLQLLTISWYYRWGNIIGINTTNSLILQRTEGSYDNKRVDSILNSWAFFKTVREMKGKLPADGLILSMRPADMYYADRKMVSYLDPRLLPIYREKSPQAAVDMLRKLGIQYIHSVDYNLPPLYNSVLQSILADARLSKIEYSNGQFQVFSLKDSGLQVTSERDLTPSKQQPWMRTLQLRIGGRKALDLLALYSEKYNNDISVSTFPFFHRDYSVLLSSGYAPGLNWNHNSDATIPVEQGEYLLDIKLHGRGLVRLWIVQFDSVGSPIMLDTYSRSHTIRTGELVLSEKYPQKDFTTRFRPHPDAKSMRIGIEQVGKSTLSIDHVSLSTLAPL